MSILITKLFRKKRILLPSVHLSQIVLSAVTSVFLVLSGSNRVGRCIRSPYTSQPNFILIHFIVNKIWLLASFIYGAITLWPTRGFSTDISLILSITTFRKQRQYYDIGCSRHGICDLRFDVHIDNEVI